MHPCKQRPGFAFAVLFLDKGLRKTQRRGDKYFSGGSVKKEAQQQEVFTLAAKRRQARLQGQRGKGGFDS